MIRRWGYYLVLGFLTFAVCGLTDYSGFAFADESREEKELRKRKEKEQAKEAERREKEDKTKAKIANEYENCESSLKICIEAIWTTGTQCIRSTWIYNHSTRLWRIRSIQYVRQNITGCSYSGSFSDLHSVYIIRSPIKS
ncbi:hypothetical protein L0222_13095 [bacterium]|nr:hypothetical protein [bacterium]MCI0602623.1 hypothetical protein [bacterium]